MKSDHKIYGFALRGTGQILYQLKTIDCCYLLYPNNIDHYLAMLLHDQPSHIIGLGLYTGVNENIVSEKISQLINQRQLHSRFVFLYIPKTMKSLKSTSSEVV